jgi:hypothetical protein
MTKRMNWDRLRYLGRPTLDWRREAEIEDAASRWLKKRVKRGRRERRGAVTASSARVAQRPIPQPQPVAGKLVDWTVTAVSSGWAVVDGAGAVRGVFTSNSAAWEWADRQERRAAWKTPYYATTACSSEEAPPW